MPREIAKAYEPQQIEPRWAEFWVKEELFKADPNAPGPVFSIVIPPPNVTGSLHIGHMLDHTEIDMLTRWHRMRGYNTLYLPGTDHAGISTQRVVVRQLSRPRDQLPRSGTRRIRQARVAVEGRERRNDPAADAADWRIAATGRARNSRFRRNCRRVVREVFVRLYEEGLIYREKRMVNWCPVCLTVLSDLGSAARGACTGICGTSAIRWRDRNEFLVVATTRPETMLGDTAIAVHPEDERYKHLIGKNAILPLMNREIPIIGDEMVDREFGTGAVKITPAHDPNDFEAGKRHNLAEIDVMTDDGHMNETPGAYAGLERFAARKKIVEDLQAQGLLEKITDHTQCDRNLRTQPHDCGAAHFDAVVLQDEAAGGTGDCGRGARRHPVVPENRREEYFNWMRNIRDWTLSRQLWWGHRIPAWYCQECSTFIVAREDPTKCPQVRVGATEARSGRAGYVVQLGLVAIFDAGLAGEDRRLREVLSDELADHRLRHPVFLGGADDHAGDAFHGESSLPRCVSAFAGAHGQRRENVQVQRHGARSRCLESAVRDRCDAFLPGVDGRAGDGHHSVRRSAAVARSFCKQDLERGALSVHEPGQV